MSEKLKVWFDSEADFLEVQFSDRPGFQKETSHHAVMARVDENGQMIGFTIMGLSQFNKKIPLETDLRPVLAGDA